MSKQVKVGLQEPILHVALTLHVLVILSPWLMSAGKSSHHILIFAELKLYCQDANLLRLEETVHMFFSGDCFPILSACLWI